ncbi:MAG: hypothetical protein AAFU85_04680 [Planctomycetota bacterium]
MKRTLATLAILLVWLALTATRHASAQSGGVLDVPQTRLAPIGGLAAPAPTGLQPGAVPGSVRGNPVPGNLGAATVPNNGFGPVPGGPVPGAAPGGFGGFGGVPNQTLIAPSLANPPSGSLFDPYAAGPAAGYTAPVPQGSIFGNLFGGRPQPSGFPPAGLPQNSLGAPASAFGAGQGQPLFGSPNLLGGPATVVPPGGFSGPTTFSGPGVVGAPNSFGFPDAAYPNSAPSSLFPGGLLGPTSSFSSTNFNPYRLIQRGRFRHTFLFGGEGADDLSINDTDFALAFAFPRFLFSNQPLFVSPNFSYHQWNGPEANTGADLPADVYSAFLDFGWQSDPARILGAELNLNVGGYTEFDLFRSESLRVRGRALGTFRVTPASTFKLGIYYYDRVRIKLLPAGGFIWQPNPFTRVDLFFPQPKYSRFIQTIGVQDVWWYVSGDYGGGSWTIDRDDGRRDQVDINDIRLITGFEWGPSERIRNGSRTAFFEFGYVFDRELVYRANPQDNLDLDDTWMVRLGIGY